MAAPSSLFSALSREDSVVALEIIKSAPANVSFSEINENGYSALHFASSKGYLGVIEALIAKGSNVNQATDAGTPLQVAILSGQIAALRTLLKNKAEPNQCSNNLPSPLVLAISRACSQCFYALIDAGADLDLESLGCSPLNVAINHNEHFMVQKLMISGADCSVADTAGLTPLEYAAVSRQTKILNYLMAFIDPIDSCPVWTVAGIIQRLNSPKELSNIEIKLKQKSENLITHGDVAELDGKMEIAIFWYSEALIADPTNHEAWANRSRCYYKLNACHDALVDAESFIRLAPQLPEGYIRKAEACEQLGKYADAASAYLEASNLDPEQQAYLEGYNQALQKHLDNLDF
ncbi:OLC1v1006920C1 [Oldenlandia corymbosa var. corymbosa]|uniref:OLC1v1006920C1 n=1 Tax=Oldenlandia corymbosa var. corymbosa TaxID=529605 RepID=A0AAV1DI56_OLDCO|nr:OLC1v1006920C1 [Oldenlandia corymbosa var. corymbosa]